MPSFPSPILLTAVIGAVFGWWTLRLLLFRVDREMKVLELKLETLRLRQRHLAMLAARPPIEV